MFSEKCNHTTAMWWEHVCFHGDREYGERIGRGWDQFPGRGLPATVPGGEATQGWREAGTVGIQNILLSMFIYKHIIATIPLWLSAQICKLVFPHSG